MVKSREFHSQILKRGKKRGWHWIKGEGDGSHRIYEDKNGIRYPVPYHGAKEMGEGLRKKIIRDIISEPEIWSLNKLPLFSICLKGGFYYGKT